MGVEGGNYDNRTAVSTWGSRQSSENPQAAPAPTNVTPPPPERAGRRIQRLAGRSKKKMGGALFGGVWLVAGGAKNLVGGGEVGWVHRGRVERGGVERGRAAPQSSSRQGLRKP